VLCVQPNSAALPKRYLPGDGSILRPVVQDRGSEVGAYVAAAAKALITKLVERKEI